MNKIRIAVLCPSEIALRRFMPALQKSDRFEYVGISCADEDEWFGTPTEQLLSAERLKAESFCNEYGGNIFPCYKELLSSDKIDAVYIPLPPSLHYKWAKYALENNKHVLLEKPFTDSYEKTRELISIAETRSLALHENYMFVYHSQLDYIKEYMMNGSIGDIRLVRIDFGFPFRGANDFRYCRELGGGALLDCGGYTLKLASVLLGSTAKVTASQLNHKDGFEVDIFGSATVTNADGLTAQVSFGMDNSYKCSIEIWGSTGTVFTNRILTAPDGFEPTVIIKQGNEEKTVKLPADDTFRKSIAHFGRCIDNNEDRILHYNDILDQAKLVETIKGG